MGKKKKLEPVSEGAVDGEAFLEGLRGRPMNLGEVLCASRELEGLSLAAYAAKLGISRGHLHDIEKGRKGVSPERAAKWAKPLMLSKERLVALALQAQLDEAGIKLRVEVHAA